MMRTQTQRLAAGGIGVALLIAGCSSTKHASAPAASSSTPAAATSAPAAASSSAAPAASAPASAPVAASSAAASTPALPAGAENLTFWSWVPGVDKVVALWNTANPTIHVTVSKPAQGDALYTKLVAASKAHTAPDLVQIEYQALPTMVTQNVVADISKNIGSAASDFSAGIWGQVTLGTGAVYAIPQDSGPMELYYRADLFQKFGLTVPTTWDQFASDAALLKQKDPTAYLANFSAGDPGWFSGLAAQAGGKWWGLNGSTWSVNINDAATTKVANFWGNLVNKGQIDPQPDWTPAWNKALDDGALLSWVSAAWAPGTISSSAPDTVGKWAMAPLPQWSAGANVSGFWGGSTTAVTTDSKHAADAAKFAVWLNTDPQAVQGLVTDGGIYPASKPGQAVPALTTAPAYFSNQPQFWSQASTIASTAVGFTWGPDVNVAYSKWSDAFKAAIQNKSSFGTAITTVQTATVADMKNAGFTLAGN